MSNGAPSGKPRRELSRLIRGSAFIFACRIFGAAATFVTQILLARWMGASELGVFVLAFSWCILLSMLSTGGFRIASIRFIGEGLTHNKPGYIAGYIKRSRQVTIAISLVVALLGSAGLLIFEPIDSAELSVFVIALLAVPFFALLNVYAGYANALSRFSLSFMPFNIFRPVLFLVAIYGLWMAGTRLNAEIVMLLNSAALAIVAVATVLFSHRLLRQYATDSQPQFETKKWIRTALPLLFVALFTGYFPALMMAMVGPWLPNDQLAIFHICLRVAMLISFGLIAIDAFTGPEVTRLITSDDREELQKVVNRITKLRFWAALAAMVLMVLLGTEVLSLFGEEFIAGYWTLIILAVAQLVQAGAGPVTRLVSLSGHQDNSIPVFGVAILAAFVLVIILVPLFGIRGAAIATLLDTLLWVAWMRFIVIKRLGIRPSVF